MGSGRAPKRVKVDVSTTTTKSGPATATLSITKKKKKSSALSRAKFPSYSFPGRDVQTMWYVRGPYPNNLYTKLSYSFSDTLTSAGGAIVTRTIGANGMYDPSGVGGRQPRYFDNLVGPNNSNTPYRFYTVLASSIKVTFWGTGPDTTGTASIVGVLPSIGNASVPGTVVELQERTQSRTGTLGHYYGGKPLAIVKHYVDVAKQLGVKDLEDSEETKCIYNANPIAAGQVMWVLAAGSINAATATTYLFNATVTFYVKFSQLEDVADS